MDSLIILDEAYIAFVDNAWSSLDMIKENNLLILRSMTKDYALAGLRLGYAVAREEIVDSLRRVCPPWNVNAVAQQAGLVALQQDKYLRQSRAMVAEAKSYLIEGKLMVLFSLVSEGDMVQIKIIEPSGHEILDKEAIRAIRAAAPFPPFPEHIPLRRLNIKASFVYRLTAKK